MNVASQSGLRRTGTPELARSSPKGLLAYISCAQGVAVESVGYFSIEFVSDLKLN